jgi:hypothetical protein
MDEGKGYHLRDIPRGELPGARGASTAELGESSKIMEEQSDRSPQ